MVKAAIRIHRDRDAMIIQPKGALADAIDLTLKEVVPLT